VWNQRRAARETFVGLDVSLGETTVCILDKYGTRIFEGKVVSKPALIARLIRKRAPSVVRVGLESGPTASYCITAAIVFVSVRVTPMRLHLENGRCTRSLPR
jgi:hypothetical protein